MYMHCPDWQSVTCGNGQLMALSGTNSSPAFQPIRAIPFPRVHVTLSHTHLLPPRALRVSGGLPKFLREADRWTFGEAFNDEGRKVTLYLETL